MTELETMQRAKMYMEKLAQGIDPITDREMPEDSLLNNVRLARCFFYVSGVLGQVIENGGTVGVRPKQKLLPFGMSQEQMDAIPVSEEPVYISQLVDRINETVGNGQMKKLKTTTITNWLLEKGFLEKQTGADGKSRRVPTASGIGIGLMVQTRQGQYGEYQNVLYDVGAQRFVLDHLLSILAEDAG